MKSKSILVVLLLLSNFFAIGQANKQLQIRKIKHLKNRQSLFSANQFYKFAINNVENNTKRLDSVVWLAQKESSGLMVNAGKYECVYDSEDRIVSKTDFEWNTLTLQWKAYYKSNYTFDADENRLQEINQFWNENTEKWLNEVMFEYTFDANGRLLIHTYYQWNAIDNLWNPIWKNAYKHDTNGNEIQILNDEWNKTATEWEHWEKSEIEYDEQGNETQNINYTWDIDTEEWIVNTKSKTEYYLNGNTLQSADYTWDKKSDTWVPTNKYEDTYDNNGFETQGLSYYWNEFEDDWILDDKYETEVDANGNFTKEISYLWDIEEKLWLKESKTEISHDLSLNLSDIVAPFWFERDFMDFAQNLPVIINQYFWDQEIADWNLMVSTQFFYNTPNSSTIKENIKGVAEIFPNPVSDILTIILPENVSQSTFELYSLQGQQLIKRETAKDISINMAGLNPGVYFYKMTSDWKIQSGKLIVR